VAEAGQWPSAVGKRLQLCSCMGGTRIPVAEPQRGRHLPTFPNLHTARYLRKVQLGHAGTDYCSDGPPSHDPKVLHGRGCARVRGVFIGMTKFGYKLSVLPEER
jgi:hypothetical protein